MIVIMSVNSFLKSLVVKKFQYEKRLKQLKVHHVVMTRCRIFEN